MNGRRFARWMIWALPALTVVGCSSVRDARETQRRLAPFGEEGTGPGAVRALDLRGRSLEALVDWAMTNRPSVVTARLAVEDARLALRELDASAPVLSATPWTAAGLSTKVSYGEQNAGTTLRDGDWRTEGDPSASLSLELLLYDFGRHSASVKAQAENVVAAELKLSEAGYTVFGEVAAAYFNYLERDALLEVARTNERRYETQKRYAEERAAAGEADKLDVLRAQLDLAQAQQKTVAASNAVASAGAALLHALGVDATRGPYQSVIGKPPFGTDTLLRGFAPTHAGLAACYEYAFTNKPSMRVQRAKMRAASHQVDYAVADLQPKLTASTGLVWTDPLWVFKWGVSGAQSLFQGFAKVRKVDRARVALEQAAAAVTQESQDLTRSLALAIETRDNAVEALRTASVSVARAKENYDTVLSQLGVGTVSRVEVSTAAGEYSTALGDRVSAFYAGQRAEAALFALLGRKPVYREERERVAE